MDINVNRETDFFAYINNFKTIEHIRSEFIYRASNYDKADITFVIPTYKRVDTLRQTLNSVINQQGEYNFTIIVIDNNPERGDDTELLMKDIDFPSLSYVKNCENLGMAGNWNRGIELCKSKWMCLLHDDDIIVPRFLLEMMPYTDKYSDAAIIQSKKYRTKSPGIIEGENCDGKIKRVRDIDFYRGHIIDVPSGIIYNKEILIKEGGFNPDFYPSLDYCLHTKIASKYPVYLVNKELTWYREGTQNASKLIEVQKGWLIVDYYLVRQLLSNHDIPKCLIFPYLEYKTVRRVNYDQRLWGQIYEIPYGKLEWKNSPNIINKIVNRLLSMIIKYFK